MDVSFIIPLYYGRKFINKIISLIEANQIELYRKECAREIEIIFVNDSPDEDIEKEDIRTSNFIKNIGLTVNSSNLGIHRARIRGLRQSQGEFIVFMDQDDEIARNYLESQYRWMGNSDAVLCNGVYRNNKVIYRDGSQQREAVTKNKFLSMKTEEAVIVSPGQVMLRRDAIPKEWQEYCLYENGNDDVFLWMLMLRDGKSFSLNPEVQYYHMEEGKNASLNFGSMKRSIVEMSRVVHENNLLAGEDLLTFDEGIRHRSKKYDWYIEILNHWRKITENIVDMFSECQYCSVAIYGYGVIGKKLLADLRKLGIIVDCVIDNAAMSFDATDYPLYTPENVQEYIDFIIITPVFAEKEIRESLMGWKSKVISLRELLGDENTFQGGRSSEN